MDASLFPGGEMKRTMWVLFALLAMCFADVALAAVATTVTGNVQAQRGSAPPRTLRVGDEVVQGDTVSTGPNSALVLRFEDGQIAALTANSRMTVTAYQYDAQRPRESSVLLSLINGGMRAITGFIGRAAPERVTYRAATVTIGVRGTDVTFLTNTVGNVVVMVSGGLVSLTWGNHVIQVPAGEGVNVHPDLSFEQGLAQVIADKAPADIIEGIGGINSLADAISRALLGLDGQIDLRTPGSTGSPVGGSASPN